MWKSLKILKSLMKVEGNKGIRIWKESKNFSKESSAKRTSYLKAKRPSQYNNS